MTEGKPADVAAPAPRRSGQPRAGRPARRAAVRVPGRRGPAAHWHAGSSGRLELAQWLTRPGHPLTARVMVNRIWQHHFGRGIVATPSNFGVRGEPPTHPELLDWLAARFVAERLVDQGDASRDRAVGRPTSSRATTTSANAALDPDNRWLWRFPRRRLDAESIRDAMLAVAGRLDRGRPGRHPFPPIEDWHWTQHDAFKAVYPSDHRSVYLMTQRLVKHPFLAIFDGPDTNASTDVRGRLDGAAPGPLLHEQPVRAGVRRGPRRPHDRRRRTTPPGGSPSAIELAWGRRCRRAERARPRSPIHRATPTRPASDRGLANARPGRAWRRSC